MNQLIHKFPENSRVLDLLAALSQNPNFLAERKLREMERLSLQDQMRKEGIQKGARNLLEQGTPVQTIAAATGLSFEVTQKA